MYFCKNQQPRDIKPIIGNKTMTMNKILEEDKNNIAEIIAEAAKEAVNYMNTIAEAPTSASAKAETQNILLGKGLGASATLSKFISSYKKYISASSGPRYLGYVTGGTTPAALIGDWLASTYDQNTQNIDGQGDLSALIEQETITLLLDLFQLPKTFIGGFVTGATMSNYTCLGVARQWLGKHKNIDIAKEGMVAECKIISAMPHSSALKSMAMLGFGSNNIIQVPTLVDREAIDITLLTAKLESLAGEKVILIASAGTVNSVDFDDMAAIAVLKEEYGFWWHIDAAFGGFVSCTEEHHHLIKGWEHADSITIDCHKWLNVPYDSAVFFIKEKHRFLQVETFQNSNAPYLGDPKDNFSYLNFLPENSRRFRALPAWFSLMAYGKEGYRDIVLQSIQLAKQLTQFIENSTEFELVAPTRLNVVCFTLTNSPTKKTVYDFVRMLNDGKKVFITPSIYKGTVCMRAAFVNWQSGTKDVDIVIEELQKTYRVL